MPWCSRAGARASLSVVRGRFRPPGLAHQGVGARPASCAAIGFARCDAITSIPMISVGRLASLGAPGCARRAGLQPGLLATFTALGFRPRDLLMRRHDRLRHDLLLSAWPASRAAIGFARCDAITSMPMTSVGKLASLGALDCGRRAGHREEPAQSATRLVSFAATFVVGAAAACFGAADPRPRGRASTRRRIRTSLRLVKDRSAHPSQRIIGSATALVREFRTRASRVR